MQRACSWPQLLLQHATSAMHAASPMAHAAAAAAAAAPAGLQTPPCSLQARRGISEEQLNASQEHLDDLFRRNMRSASRRRPDDGRPRVMTTRREALALYREILRYSNLFVWRDQQGRTFRDLIRQSTRKEFEDASIETDPEIVNRLIITGRDSMHRTVETYMAKRQQIIEDEARNMPHQ